MSAPKRIPDAALREAMREWAGNKTAAAAAVGMTRNNFLARLAVMEETPMSTKTEGPVMPARAKPVIVRVLPDHRERLRQARFDLEHKHRTSFDETAILAAFFGDAFESWLASKLAEES